MDLLKLRFVIATCTLLAVCLAGAGVLFCGAGLTQLQVGLLTVIIMALIGEMKSSSAWLFDGTADAPADPVPVAAAPTAAAPLPTLHP